MLSVSGDFTLPTAGNMANITWVNAGDFFGAVASLAGGRLLLAARGSATGSSRVSHD